ncbi:MAG: suppressor of fused domain protein [Candidatus Aphodosoma sp.]
MLDIDDNGEFGRVVLQPKDMTAKMKSILSFWSMYLNDLPIEEMPIYYCEEEYNEIENYIENSFGEIYRVGDVEGLKEYGVDLAVIKPTAGKPYYTLSTIGLGAHRIDNDEETRHEIHAPDYCEFVMYLPTDWNVTDDGCEKPENFWPVRIIQMAVETLISEKANIRDGIYIEDDTLAEKCGLKIVYIENPMPDITKHTFVNTTSGRTVQFYQLVPFSEEDAEIMEQTDTYYELVSRITGVEFNEDSSEATNNAVSQALLSNTLDTFITAKQQYWKQQ